MILNKAAWWESTGNCNDDINVLLCTHFDQVFREYMVDLKQKPEAPRWTEEYVYEALQLVHIHSQGRDTGIYLESEELMRLAVLVGKELMTHDRFLDNYNEQRKLNNLHKQLHRKWAKK